MYPRTPYRAHGNGQPWRSFDRRPKPDPSVNWRTGPLITEIKLSDLDLSDIEATEPKITDVEYLASYNWLENEPGTILVPGELLCFPS
jgi:hypothetical protein